MKKTFRCTGVLVLLITAITFTFMERLHAASQKDLDAAIIRLTVSIDRNVNQQIVMQNALKAALAPPLSLTAGTALGPKGTTIDFPVYFKEGTKGVAALQFDIHLSSAMGLDPLSVSPGIAALAAAKSTQGNIVNGGYRVIVFGLNQTVIPSGPVAVIRVSINSSVASGKQAISLVGTLGSDPDGNAVPLSPQTGSLIVE